MPLQVSSGCESFAGDKTSAARPPEHDGLHDELAGQPREPIRPCDARRRRPYFVQPAPAARHACRREPRSARAPQPSARRAPTIARLSPVNFLWCFPSRPSYASNRWSCSLASTVRTTTACASSPVGGAPVAMRASGVGKQHARTTWAMRQRGSQRRVRRLSLDRGEAPRSPLSALSNLGSVTASAVESAARAGVAEARRVLDVNVGPHGDAQPWRNRTRASSSPGSRSPAQQSGPLVLADRRIWALLASMWSVSCASESV
jgi:hypothetical protein